MRGLSVNDVLPLVSIPGHNISTFLRSTVERKPAILHSSIITILLFIMNQILFDIHKLLSYDGNASRFMNRFHEEGVQYYPLLRRRESSHLYMNTPWKQRSSMFIQKYDWIPSVIISDLLFPSCILALMKISIKLMVS